MPGSNQDSAKAQHSLLFDTMLHGAVFHATDGTIVSMNRAAEQIIGVTREEMYGVRPQTLHYQTLRSDGSIFPGAEHPVMVALRTGKEVQNVVMGIYNPKLEAYRWINITAVPLFRNGETEPFQVYAVFDDITERRVSEERWRVMAETMPAFLFTARTDGGNDYINNRFCEYTGMTMEEVKNEGWLNALHPDDVPATVERWMECLRTKTAFEIESRWRRHDGEYRWFMTLSSPVKDSSGVVVNWLGVCMDVHDQRLAREEAMVAKSQAEAANRAKDEFLAALSHELRTPLNPVLLLASAMAEDMTLSKQIRTDFEMIRKSVLLQARLIDDLLDVTRISRGKLKLQPAVHGVHDVLHQTLDVVRGDISEKQIDLRLELRAQKERVLVDSVRLQQVFWNVIKNAVKFTPLNGVVSIQTHNSAEDKITIQISDSGPGIDIENLESIFEAFAQVGAANAIHRFGGLGLGLSISRRLIEIQGGRIWAENQGQSGGAKFLIELPLALTNEKETSPVARSHELAPPGTGLKILLLEDHEPTRMTMLRLLKMRGHNVGCAASLAEARELASREKWQLVISDLGLADGNGYTFMQEIRASQGIPGLALSGYGTETDIAKSLEAGFTQHLVKPLNIQELDQAIATVQAGLRSTLSE